MPLIDTRADPAISEALALLGKERVLLVAHDASFPAVGGEDSGRGTPYGAGGEAFARFARALGFTGLQLGPQGQTSPVNASPYDGTLFSRNLLSLDLAGMVRDGLLSRRTWEDILAGNPRADGSRVAYAYALQAYARAVEEMHGRFAAGAPVLDAAGGGSAPAGDDQSRAASRRRLLAPFWHDNVWLRDDALYEALCLEHGRLPWRQWPTRGEAAYDQALCAPPPVAESACAARRRMLETKYAQVLERYAFVQWLLLQQHQNFRERMQGLGLKIYGDVQVGFSLRDAWSRRSLLLEGYLLGAPPSRTNVDGQPWSYQVLDPAQYVAGDGRPGPVLAFITERLGKMLSEFDGLRLDHPHGLVCPWVYRADDPNPYHAVQNGTRLFSAPNLPDHPTLAQYAIVHRDQLNRDRLRYADDWVRDLTPAQEDRYALLMDALMEQVRAHGLQREDILCEVLSTEPLPLNRVRRRHDLGRFRVTQKADLENPYDVYRSENAQPEDWVMVGNHDTPSIWRLSRAWAGQEAGRSQAEYLAQRLGLADPGALAADHRRLAHAKVADLFLSHARNLMVSFADLLGLEETYNTPGTVNGNNWTLRVPPDFARRYDRMRQEGSALNIQAALALALRARPDISRPDLIARLEERAGWRIA
ncbi:MAG: 4-alpha-glucanotransferase [Chromatiaceae bacterium]